MKQRIWILAALMPFASCREEKEHSAEMALMRDVIFEKYSGVVATTINVKEGNKLIVTLCDQQAYEAPAADRQRMANELGLMAVELFGRDNGLEQGQLILTRDAKNTLVNPPDGLVSNINLDSLNKVAAGKAL